MTFRKKMTLFRKTVSVFNRLIDKPLGTMLLPDDNRVPSKSFSGGATQNKSYTAALRVLYQSRCGKKDFLNDVIMLKGI